MFWPLTVWKNCSSDLKSFANSRPSASNFKSFSQSLEQFFLTVGQNNFGNKIPFLQFFCQNFILQINRADFNVCLHVTHFSSIICNAHCTYTLNPQTLVHSDVCTYYLYCIERNYRHPFCYVATTILRILP